MCMTGHTFSDSLSLNQTLRPLFRYSDTEHIVANTGSEMWTQLSSFTCSNSKVNTFLMMCVHPQWTETQRSKSRFRPPCPPCPRSWDDTETQDKESNPSEHSEKTSLTYTTLCFDVLYHDQMRVEGLLFSPTNKKHSLLIRSFKILRLNQRQLWRQLLTKSYSATASAWNKRTEDNSDSVTHLTPAHTPCSQVDCDCRLVAAVCTSVQWNTL